MGLPSWDLDSLLSDPALEVMDKAYAVLVHTKDNRESMVLRVRLAPGAVLDLTAGPNDSMIAGDGRGADFCFVNRAAPSAFVTHWAAANLYCGGRARPILRVSLLRFSPDDRVVQDVTLYEAAAAAAAAERCQSTATSPPDERLADCQSAC